MIEIMHPVYTILEFPLHQFLIASGCEFSQVIHSDVYMLEGDGSKWKKLAPMPKPNSHIETAWVMVNNSIIIVGGTTRSHPLTKKMNLVGEVFRFRLDTLVSHESVKYHSFSLFSKAETLLRLIIWGSVRAGMVCNWENAISDENNACWILERLVILLIWPKR